MARTVLATLAISSVIILVPVVAITLGASDLSELTGGDIGSMVTAWSNSATGTFVSLCVALAIINAGIVMVIQNSRVLFASARDKAWPSPVNTAFARLGRFGSPWVATLAVGVPGAALCFVNLDTLYGVTGVSVTAMYLLVAVAALLSRRTPHKHTPAWRMPLWPHDADPPDSGPDLHPDPAGHGVPAVDRRHHGGGDPVLGPLPASAQGHEVARLHSE